MINLKNIFNDINKNTNFDKRSIPDSNPEPLKTKEIDFEDPIYADDNEEVPNENKLKTSYRNRAGLNELNPDEIADPSSSEDKILDRIDFENGYVPGNEDSNYDDYLEFLEEGSENNILSETYGHKEVKPDTYINISEAERKHCARLALREVFKNEPGYELVKDKKWVNWKKLPASFRATKKQEFQLAFKRRINKLISQGRQAADTAEILAQAAQDAKALQADQDRQNQKLQRKTGA